MMMRQAQAEIELTYNYGVERYDTGTAFGHIALQMPDVAAACEAIRAAGGTINIVLKRAVKTAQRELKLSAAKSADQNSPSGSLQAPGRRPVWVYRMAARSATSPSTAGAPRR